MSVDGKPRGALDTQVWRDWQEMTTFAPPLSRRRGNHTMCMLRRGGVTRRRRGLRAYDDCGCEPVVEEEAHGREVRLVNS